MVRVLIKPFNQIFKTIELYNSIIRQYKQKVEEHTHRTVEPVFDELEYRVFRGGRTDPDEIIIDAVANGESFTIMHRKLIDTNTYQDVGILVDFYLERAIDLALENEISINNEFHNLMENRYKQICDLSEKITQQRIKDGVIGHLTVFAKTDAIFKNPVTRAEFEDELTNEKGYCRPEFAVEYYSTMRKFLNHLF